MRWRSRQGLAKSLAEASKSIPRKTHSIAFTGTLPKATAAQLSFPMVYSYASVKKATRRSLNWWCIKGKPGVQMGVQIVFVAYKAYLKSTGYII